MRRKILERYHLYTNEETACRRMTNFTKFTELKNLGKLLYKLKCKWEKHVEENGANFRGGGEEALHTQVKVRQSRYRPGVAPRVPGS